MNNLNKKLERIKNARTEKPVDVLMNKKFLRKNKKENIKYWLHEINVLHNEEYKDHFPEEDPYKTKEFESTAVVGNSGSLLNSGRGEEIDEHDKVIRFNTAPIGNYDGDVGSRTDFRVSIGSLTYRSGNEKLLRSYRRNVQAVKDKDNVLEKSWHLIFTHQFCDWVQDFKENENNNSHVCSTGFQGVFFAILLSKKVNLYGFNLPTENSDFKYHYYNDNDYVERSHKFKQEHALYDYLDANADWFTWKEL